LPFCRLRVFKDNMLPTLAGIVPESLRKGINTITNSIITNKI
jgi:hypothetical protein